jgi:glutamyl-tRNA synthetase
MPFLGVTAGVEFVSAICYIYPVHNNVLARDQPLSTVRVRFAPSPTGYLHVGGLRTALYNYLFARRNKGVLILRVEDTDRSRYVEGAVENLIRTLQWAGLEFDEGPGKEGGAGPYVQSERIATYRTHVDMLLASGNAYYAFDTPEELEEMRKKQEKLQVPVREYRRALDLSAEDVRRKLASGTPAVVRMKMPVGETVAFEDIVRGSVEFSSDGLDDQVLLKSDGYPTYHLANVVDDHLMGITHVIRGEEWLPSTPKHVLLYRYFGWEPPRFAHLPLLLNPDKSKLSKRQGDVAVEEYRSRDFFPEALVNFVALLGWNPGDEREIFTLQELEKEFTLERVGKSGAVFNVEKLNWMNAEHLRRKPDAALLELTRPFLAGAGITDVSDGYMLDVIRLLKERVEHTGEFISTGMYFFRDPDSYDEQARKKHWKTETAPRLRQALSGFRDLASFLPGDVESVVRTTATALGIGAGGLIHPLRLTVTGVAQGPGLFELMAVLGKETSVRRIDRGLSVLG